MKIDLCELFGVEEGEEFKFGKEKSIKYRIYNGELNCTYIDCENDWSKSHLEFNDINGAEIIKLPKKKQFTDDELCILRNIDEEYKWIARDEDGELYLFKEKPCKSLGVWETKSARTTEFLCYNYLFQSITSEDKEPVFIDDYVERGAK